MSWLRNGCLLLGFCVLVGGSARAQDQLPFPRELPVPAEKPRPRPETPPPPAAEAPRTDCGPVVEKTVHTRNILLQENQEETTLPDLPVREVAVSQRAGVLEVAYREERRTVTVMETKPCEAEYDELSTRMEAVTCVDPATGCAHTEYRPVPVVRKVKVTHYQTVPVQREVLVKVPYLRPVEVDVVVKTLAVDRVTLPAVRTTLTAVPQETEVTAPIPAPCPASCPAGDPFPIPESGALESAETK